MWCCISSMIIYSILLIRINFMKLANRNIHKKKIIILWFASLLHVVEWLSSSCRIMIVPRNIEKFLSGMKILNKHKTRCSTFIIWPEWTISMITYSKIQFIDFNYRSIIIMPYSIRKFWNKLTWDQLSYFIILFPLIWCKGWCN